MYQDGEDDPNCCPKNIDVILGRTWAFKVRLQGKNRPTLVMRVSIDIEIIDHIKSLFPKEEVLFVIIVY